MSKLAKILFSSTIIFALAAFENGFEGNKFISLNSDWKVTFDDNLDYLKPDYDNSKWENIKVDDTLENQGHKDYNGFAWYRVKVFISSNLKKNAALTDSLIFNLGKIDDFDQTFFNGVFIGENAKNVQRGAKPTDDFKKDNYTYWNVHRRYSIPIGDEIIKWDDYNVLAIRIYDWGGAGGIFSGGLNIKMPELYDYFKFDINESEFTDKNEKLEKEIILSNTSQKYQIKGELIIKSLDNIKESENILIKKNIILNHNEKKKMTFDFLKPTNSTDLVYQFKIENSDKAFSEKEGIPYILTPHTKAEPQINGALVYGQGASKPFLYKIAATGKRPMIFDAKNLPKGLLLNKEKGIISGKVKKKGHYSVQISAKNDLGKDSKTLEIVIGKNLALTPPMGWNSWNCWGLTVSEKKIYDVAKAFIELGLADHGWTFINIDDGWEIYGKSDKPKRSADGEILTNEKFPDMKKLADNIHALGLKLGIYSSPGALTCGGYTGSYGYEDKDANTLAKWGIDYLKYDLCGYRDIMKNQYSPEELMPPYKKMNKALKKVERDIIYSICEYGNGKVWEWGESLGGNLWRTTGDIWDDWDRMKQIGFGQVESAKYGGVGHWNDPDMLVVGWIGWGENLHRSKLTPDEQYTHVSLWALLSAPLLLGNDLTRVDDFTMNLITNDEVIAIDQDKLGIQATPRITKDNIQVWRKPLYNGDIAVGIFNLGEKTEEYHLNLKDIGINEEKQIFDVWRQKELGLYKIYEAKIPVHGVVLLKIKK